MNWKYIVIEDSSLAGLMERVNDKIRECCAYELVGGPGKVLKSTNTNQTFGRTEYYYKYYQVMRIQESYEDESN